MASKRARSSGAVRPAFGVSRDDEADEDDDLQSPGQQSRRAEADPAAQAAAVRWPGDAATACVFCCGHWTAGDRFEHDSACLLGGRTVTERQAQRHRDGLD